MLSLRDRHETVSYARVLRCRELQQFTVNEKRHDALIPAKQTGSATEMGEILEMGEICAGLTLCLSTHLRVLTILLSGSSPASCNIDGVHV